jgi:hypothetical protein
VELLCEGGEVGDGVGWLGERCPGDVAVPPPFMAARCEEERTALSAAFAGSRACSIKDFSWLDWR